MKELVEKINALAAVVIENAAAQAEKGCWRSCAQGFP